MRALERFLLLQIIDQRWREHLYDMDYLREGIHLRGFAQIEPLVAYKNEAYELFRDLMNSIWGDFARQIFHVEVVVEGENPNGGAPATADRAGRAPRSSSSTGRRNVTYSGGAAAAAQRAGHGGRRGRRGRAGRVPACRARPAGEPPAPHGRAAPRRRRPSRSGATTRAGADRARSTRSATAPSATAPVETAAAPR